MFLLSLPHFMRAGLIAFLAHFADQTGKKRTGLWGQFLCFAGVILLILGGSFEQNRMVLTAAGLTLFGIGSAMFGSSWLALLSPLIGESERGHFLGKLRFSWQLSGILFGLIGASLFVESSSLAKFQWVFAFLALCLLVRMCFYATIPEVENTYGVENRFWPACRLILRIPGYRSFCIYAFAVLFLTSSWPYLFSLVHIEVFGFGGNTVWLLGVVMLFGSLVGSLIAGTWIDRLGPRPIFTLVHVGFAMVAILFFVRGQNSWITLLGASMSCFLFTLVRSAANVAFHVVVLNFVPQQNKSLATSICKAVMHLGEGGSSFLAASVIRFVKHDPLSNSAYGSVLATYAVLVLLAVMVPILGTRLPWLGRKSAKLLLSSR